MLLAIKSEYGERHEYAANILSSMAQVYSDVQQYDKSMEYYSQALDIILETSGPDSDVAAGLYLGMGAVAGDLGDHQKSLKLYESALSIYQASRQGPDADVATALNNIAYAYQNMGDTSKAVEFFQKALEIDLQLYGENHPITATRYNNIAYIYDLRGEYDEAVKMYEKSLAIRIAAYGEVHPDVALAYNNLALTYKKQDKFGKAIEMYEKAIQISLQVFGEEHTNTGVFYDNLGNIYDAQGDYERGLEKHIKARDIFVKVLGENSQSTAIAYNNIAVSYDVLGDYAKSIDSYEKAIAIMESVYGPDNYETAITIDNLGAIFRKTGDNERAIEYHLKALATFEKMLGPDHVDVAVAHNNIALSLDEDKRYEEALEHYGKALKIWTNTFGDQHPSVAIVHNNMGLVFRNIGDEEQAVAHFRAARASLCSGDAAAPPGQCRAGDITVNAFWFGARALAKLENFEESAQWYMQAADALDAMRVTLQSENSKKLFGKKFYELFPEGMGALAALAVDKGDTTYFESAFLLAEKGLGRVFLEMLGRSQATVRGGLPDDVIAQGITLEARVNEALQNVNAEVSKPRDQQRQESRQAAYANLQQTQADLESYKQQLLDDYPMYADLMRPSPQELNTVRDAVLGDNEAALEFILGGSASWIIFITRDQLRMAKLPPRDKIENLVSLFRSKLTDPQPDEELLKRMAGKLYDTLLAPVADGLKSIDSLLIIPTGQLYFLPFESLSAEFDGAPDYLVNHYNIRYAPSMNVLYLSKQASAAKTVGTGWLGFGDPVYAPDDPRLTGDASATGENEHTRGLVEQFLASEERGGSFIPRIPGTGEEVKTIASIFGSSNDENLNLGLDASEARFKQFAPGGYATIHVASHGTLGAGDGFEPSLILSTIGEPEGQDGFLQMSEVFNMKVPSRLVVLSACETGRGKLEQGEGVAGMSRAFLYAGADALVVSLWTVSDVGTMELMKDFYHLMSVENMPRDQALLQAKRNMAAQGRSPYFWAPFIYMGLR